MKVIIAGVPREIADSYAARMIEQGKAIPAPPPPPVPRAEYAPAKKKGVSKDEPEKQD